MSRNFVTWASILSIDIVRNFSFEHIQDLTVYSNTYFGESSGPCHLDALHCNGYEANVLSCSRNSIGPHNCNCAPGNEAGVKCNGMCADFFSKSLFSDCIYMLSLTTTLLLCIIEKNLSKYQKR